MVSILPDLESGRTYSWNELAASFGFKAAYLGAAGGMIPRPVQNALLLITHPGGGKSFNYEDYWDQNGTDLIYTGRGKSGDQTLDGPNGDVAHNRKRLLVFSHVGSRALQFIGQASCSGYWTARGSGDDGADRLIIRFRLRFDQAPHRFLVTDDTARPDRSTRQPAQRRSRIFDSSQTIASFAALTAKASPEDTLVLQERAMRGHRDILIALNQFLVASRWHDISEIPAAIDLWATGPDGTRVIFEAKTITSANESHQCRVGFAQLREYQYFYGAASDQLCLVVDRPISDARVRFLESARVAIVSVCDGCVRPIGILAAGLLDVS